MPKLQRPDSCKDLHCQVSIDEVGMEHVVHHRMPQFSLDWTDWRVDSKNLGVINMSDIQTDLNFWVAAVHAEAAQKARDQSFADLWEVCSVLNCDIKYGTDQVADRDILRHNDKELLLDHLYLTISSQSAIRALIKDFLSTQHAQTTTGAKPVDSSVIYDLYGKPIKSDFEEALPHVHSGWTPEQIVGAKLVIKYRKQLGRKVFMELAADNGCIKCKRDSSLSIDPPMGNYGKTDVSHDNTKAHLSHVMACEPEEVIPLIEYVLGDDGTFLEPESRPQSFYGWRGYKPADRFPVIQGAWNQVWNTPHYAATCPHAHREDPRETCIEHIKTRGQTTVSVLEDLAGRVVFQDFSGSECTCGIYGYSKYDGLIQQQADSNFIFTFMAYGAAWGYVAMDKDENFKATDFRIDHMYLLKNRMNAHMGRTDKALASPWSQYDSFDWKGLAKAYEDHYGVKVYVVPDENGVRMWEDLQTLTNPAGVEGDDDDA